MGNAMWFFGSVRHVFGVCCLVTGVLGVIGSMVYGVLAVKSLAVAGENRSTVPRIAARAFGYLLIAAVDLLLAMWLLGK